MPKPSSKRLTEAQILVALQAKFKHPEYALLPQVRNGTGFQRTTRTADAVAMSLWPSRGLELHGFEIKASRSDWLHEKGNPEKAEEIASRCDRWWLVAGDETVVEPAEIPPTWGLLVMKGKSLRVVREAPKLEGKPIDRAFLAALLRQTIKNIDRSEIDAAVALAKEEARKTAFAEAERNGPYELKQVRDQLTEVNKRLNAFEEKSGIKIDHWDYGRIGDAVAFLTASYGNERRNPIEMMKKVVAEAKVVAEEAERALAKMEEKPYT